MGQIWEVVISEVPGAYDSKKPAEYQTSDYDVLYRTTMSKTIEGFGAEHDKIGNRRVLVFDIKKLERTCKQYDIDVSTVLAVHRTEPEKDENITKPDENTTSDNKDITTKDNETDVNGRVYGSTASTASTADPEVTKTSEYLRNLQEAERTRIQKSKSQVAEAAKANLSGDGVMTFGQDEEKKEQ